MSIVQCSGPYVIISLRLATGQLKMLDDKVLILILFSSASDKVFFLFFFFFFDEITNPRKTFVCVVVKIDIPELSQILVFLKY